MNLLNKRVFKPRYYLIKLWIALACCGLLYACGGASENGFNVDGVGAFEDSIKTQQFHLSPLQYRIEQQGFTPRIIGNAHVTALHPMPRLSRLVIRYSIFMADEANPLEGEVTLLLINGEGRLEINALLPIHDVEEVEISISPNIWYPVGRATLVNAVVEPKQD